MHLKRRPSTTIQSFLLGVSPLLLAAACGGAPDESSSHRSMDPAGPESTAPEPVTKTAEQLLQFGVNFSQNLVSNSTRESETSAVVLDSPPGTTLGLAVAFNTNDPAHSKPNGDDTQLSHHECKGYSHVGMSYYTNGAVRGIHFATPPNQGVSYLFGDPGLVVEERGSFWLAYVYTLAISDATWNAAPKQSDGCVSYSDLYNNVTVDRGCITSVRIPKDGSAAIDMTSNGGAICFSGLGGEIDGGALYRSAATANIYTAWWNVTRGKIEVFKNGVQLGLPFSIVTDGGYTMVNHPIFASSKPTATKDELPTVIAPDNFGRFWLSRYDEQKNTWTTAQLTGSGTYSEDEVTLKGTTTTIRHIGYTAETFTENGLNYLYFFYSTKKDSSGIKRLQGATCTFVGASTHDCNVLGSGITPGNASAFLPALAAVSVSGGSYHPWLSYWTDNVNPAGTVQMVMARVDRVTGSMTRYPVGGVETPCPRGLSGTPDYWGDYDTLSIVSQGSSQPSLVRYLTDSTASTCQVNAGNPQHISAIVGNGAL